MIKRLSLACVLSLVIVFATSHPAFADETICGSARVNYIQLHESNEIDVPVAPCDLTITFLTRNKQIYTFDATAFGTQINLALLKAFNWNEPIDVCLGYILPDPTHAFAAWVKSASFPAADDPTPPTPPTGACCTYIPPDDVCVEWTEAQCNSDGGFYYGDGTDCSTVECPL